MGGIALGLDAQTQSSSTNSLIFLHSIPLHTHSDISGGGMDPLVGHFWPTVCGPLF